jgi:hypothetical protein
MPNIIIIKLRMVKWAEHVAFMGEKRKVYKVFIGKYEGWSLGRPSHR